MNPVALVTGASRGIGRGIALELASLGFDLIVHFASNAAAAAETSQACQSRAQQQGRTIQALTWQADLSIEKDRRQLVGFARRSFPHLDLLVNNAGIAPAVRADLLDTSEASLDRLFSVNVKGPLFLTQEIARWMIESAPTATGPRPGRAQSQIVFISSISAYTASTNRADYCVSKAGLSMLTPLFAARLAEHGIRVFEIRPGIIATDMTAPVKQKYDQLLAGGLTPLPRWGTPEDVGRAVAAIAQGSFPYSTGEVINVDGGFHLRRL